MLNTNNSKIVKAMNFKFDVHVLKNSPDTTIKNLSIGSMARVT